MHAQRPRAQHQVSSSDVCGCMMYEFHTMWTSVDRLQESSMWVLGIELTGTELRLGSKQFSTVLFPIRANYLELKALEDNKAL